MQEYMSEQDMNSDDIRFLFALPQGHCEESVKILKACFKCDVPGVPIA